MKEVFMTSFLTKIRKIIDWDKGTRLGWNNFVSNSELTME
jgi:hypothetical protein